MLYQRRIMNFAVAFLLATALHAQNICAGCHRGIWETYQRTGMARSFSRPTMANTLEDYAKQNAFYHQPSDSHFTMRQRDGRLFQRRYQIDFAGKEVNVLEKQVDFVMGSGNHARTYLHQTERGTLVELPLGWYAEKGGYWGMNPGYDRPDHAGFRRTIGYDCMFCHNGYPQIPAGHEEPFAEPVYQGALPEGIDCQRCHGSGRQHALLAGSGKAKPEEIRKAIVNPARLSPDRQMEACMVCHLETTSFPLPNALQRYERGPFSYRPGEPMADFLLTFDHALGTGHENKFEIVSAAYRLRKSQCFLKSNGKLLCTTCHNPHDIPRGAEATQHYTAVCRQCHATLAENHPRKDDCAGCHMPKRRTEDVVHVSVTDHYIQRRLPPDLLAEMPERHETYRGPVALYYPKTLPPNDPYLAIAQVIQQSNLSAGIPQLTAALQRAAPKRAEYYYELAEAWRDSGNFAKAIPQYREAIQRNPNFVVGLQKLGFALRTSGQNSQALESLKRAAALAPNLASTWLELGLTYRALNNKSQAAAAFEKAVALDPDLSEAHNNLGILSFSNGDRARAESAFREAIRLQPDLADAHGNLANLLSGAEALYHFEIALRLRPNDATTHYQYAVALGRERRYDDAQHELEAALRLDPKLVDAHELLGDLLMAKNDPQAALPHYREAVRLQPDFSRAHLGLGAALIAVGDKAGAIPHLQKAASDADPSVRDEAAQMLRQLEKR